MGQKGLRLAEPRIGGGTILALVKYKMQFRPSDPLCRPAAATQVFTRLAASDNEAMKLGWTRSPLEKILPFDLLRAELFYPTCSANIQSTDMTTEIAGEMAQAVKLNMADKRKATSLYILDGVKA